MKLKIGKVQNTDTFLVQTLKAQSVNQPIENLYLNIERRLYQNIVGKLA